MIGRAETPATFIVSMLPETADIVDQSGTVQDALATFGSGSNVDSRIKMLAGWTGEEWRGRGAVAALLLSKPVCVSIRPSEGTEPPSHRMVGTGPCVSTTIPSPDLPCALLLIISMNSSFAFAMEGPAYRASNVWLYPVGLTGTAVALCGGFEWSGADGIFKTWTETSKSVGLSPNEKQEKKLLTPRFWL